MSAYKNAADTFLRFQVDTTVIIEKNGMYYIRAITVDDERKFLIPIIMEHPEKEQPDV